MSQFGERLGPNLTCARTGQRYVPREDGLEIVVNR